MTDKILHLHYDDLGNEHSKLSYLRGELAFNPYQYRSQYVPYFPVRQNVPKTLNGILESKERVYLKHLPYDKPKKESSEQTNVTTINEEEENAENILHLDLGVEPLRRILFDMKKVGNEHIHQSYDPYVTRHSGLPRYCNYIHDKTMKMRDHQFTLKKLQKDVKDDKFIR